MVPKFEAFDVGGCCNVSFGQPALTTKSLGLYIAFDRNSQSPSQASNVGENVKLGFSLPARLMMR